MQPHPPHPLALQGAWRRYQELAIAQLMPKLSEAGATAWLSMHQSKQRHLLALFVAIQTGRSIVLVSDLRSDWLKLWKERCRPNDASFAHLVDDVSLKWPHAEQRLPLLTALTWKQATLTRPTKLQRGSTVQERLAPRVVTAIERAQRAEALFVFDDVQDITPYQVEFVHWLSDQSKARALLLSSLKPGLMKASWLGRLGNQKIEVVEVAGVACAAENDLRSWRERVHWVLAPRHVVSAMDADSKFSRLTERARKRAQALLDSPRPEDDKDHALRRCAQTQGSPLPLWSDLVDVLGEEGALIEDDFDAPLSDWLSQRGVELSIGELASKQARVVLTVTNPRATLGAIARHAPSIDSLVGCVAFRDDIVLFGRAESAIRSALGSLSVGLVVEPLSESFAGLYRYRLPLHDEQLRLAIFDWFNHQPKAIWIAKPDGLSDWSSVDAHSWLDCSAASSPRLRRHVLNGLLSLGDGQSRGGLSVVHLVALPPYEARWSGLTKGLCQLVRTAQSDFSLAADGVFEQGAGAWDDSLRGSSWLHAWRLHSRGFGASATTPPQPFVRGRALEGVVASQVLVGCAEQIGPHLQSAMVGSDWTPTWKKIRSRRREILRWGLSVGAGLSLAAYVLSAAWPLIAAIACLAATYLKARRPALEEPHLSASDCVRRAIRVWLRTLPVASKKVRELDVGIIDVPGRQLVVQIEGDAFRSKVAADLQAWLLGGAADKGPGLLVTTRTPLSSHTPTNSEGAWVALPEALKGKKAVHQHFAQAWQVEFGPCVPAQSRPVDSRPKSLQWPTATVQVRNVLQ